MIIKTKNSEANRLLTELQLHIWSLLYDYISHHQNLYVPKVDVSIAQIYRQEIQMKNASLDRMSVYYY